MKKYLKSYPKRILNSFKAKPLESTLQSLLLLTAFTIPLPIKINSISVVILTISIVGYAIYKRDKKGPLFNKSEKFKILLFGSLYVIQILGLLYTTNFNGAKHHLEVKATILLFPVLFSVYKIRPKLKRKLLLVFLLSCNILCLFALYFHFSFYTKNDFYYALSNIGFLVYTGLPETGIHPVYFSSYLLFSIVIAHFFLSSSESKGLKLLIILDVLFLSFFILLLSSRVIIITYLLFLFSFLLATLRHRSLAFKLVTFVVAFGLLGVSLYSLPIANRKLTNIVNQLSDKNLQNERGDYIDGVSTRTQKWKASIIIAKESFFFGVGTGDAGLALQKAYREIGFSEGIQRKFNSHNEYLQEFIRHGIVGLIILILCYSYSVLLSVKSRDYLFFSFMVIIILFSLTESILSVQKGVVFYSFFNSLFAFTKTDLQIHNFRNPA